MISEEAVGRKSTMETWIVYFSEKPKQDYPTAVASSPGLRSVGKLALDHLIQVLKPKLYAKLYSTHLPAIHGTIPSYAASPLHKGEGGVLVEDIARLPAIEFYLYDERGMVLVRGYQPNFHGQYEVAEATLNELKKLGVKTIYVLAGHGRGGKGVDGASTNRDLLKWLEKLGAPLGYFGPFLGFSGLVFGLAQRHGIDSIALFGRTTPDQDDPEYPDASAARSVLEVLRRALSLEIPLEGLEAPTRVEAPPPKRLYA